MPNKPIEIIKAEQLVNEFHITKETLPVNIDAILQAKGFSTSERELPENLAAVLDTHIAHKPVLLIDKHQTPEKKRFVKACELGHYLLDTDFSGIRMDKKTFIANALSGTNATEIERRADRFAAALLMPKPLLDDTIKANATTDEDDTLATIGKIFAVGAGIALFGLWIASLGNEKK